MKPANTVNAALCCLFGVFSIVQMLAGLARAGGVYRESEPILENVTRLESGVLPEPANVGLPVKAIFKENRHQYLPKTMSTLREGGDLTVVIMGDSIVNDTFHGAEPALDLVGDHFGAQVTRKLATRGSTSSWWFKEVEDDPTSPNFGVPRVETWVLDHEPDLVMIGGISHRNDIESVRDVVGQIRDGRPGTEIVLMTGSVNLQEVPTSVSLEINPDEDSFDNKLYRLADELETGFINLRGPFNQYVMDAHAKNPDFDVDFFQRDNIHADFYTGKVVLGNTVNLFFTPEPSTLTLGVMALAGGALLPFSRRIVRGRRRRTAGT